YLAQVGYILEAVSNHEVVLRFNIVEHHKVAIGSITIIGNNYFSDHELISKLIMQPLTRSPKFKAMTSFQSVLQERDQHVLGLHYKNAGFINVNIAEPEVLLTQNRREVHITYRIEEGEQFDVGSVSVSGDVEKSDRLFSADELKAGLTLGAGELFRLNRFHADVDSLMRKYNDRGYAYASVDPRTNIDAKNRRVHVDYHISKGTKVYFGKIDIVGNSKTRDNVIRRELNVHEGELFNGTNLMRSKSNVQRLGFFDAVRILRQQDREKKDIIHLRVEVEERSTGQIQAAAIFTPVGGASRSGWAGQGRYDEKNQLGKGWSTNLTGRWSGANNFSLDLGFNNPRVYDSHWTFGTSFFHMRESKRYVEDEFLDETRQGSTVSVGRRIYEHVIGTLSYRLQNVAVDTDAYVLSKFRDWGVSSSLMLSLARNATNDYLEPTAGSTVSLFQVVAGGELLRGDHRYLESGFDFSYYYPIDFSASYRTHIRVHGLASIIYPFGKTPVPFTQRYRLGGFQDLRGFPYWSVGPKFNVMRSPADNPVELNYGGNRKVMLQLEYFIPLIQEARAKALLFADIGRVYQEQDSLSLDGFRADVGFGLRLITPIAPLRFEWAYPIENGKLGDVEFIFYLGF
ncbi:MAG: outer membrane protein assembly factor BamA, partial [Pseudomonadota bacterium]|nr:outer membrane protein assembly factor BamA [Pseudomonadota bacterium]